MSYSKRTNQYILSFTISKDLHDKLNNLYIVNKSHFIRNLIEKELSKRLESKENKELIKKD